MGYFVWLPAVAKRCWNLLAAFSLGGTESAIFAYLLRTHFRPSVQKMLHSRSKQLLMVRFTPPLVVPHPLLQFNDEELRPTVVANLRL